MEPSWLARWRHVRTALAPRDLAGAEPYLTLHDRDDPPGWEAMARAMRSSIGPGARWLGPFDPERPELPEGAILVATIAAWTSHHRALASLDPGRVLLSIPLPDDPAGCSALASACPEAMEGLVRDDGFTRATAQAVAGFAGRWLGARLQQGRLLPMAGLAMREHTALVARHAADIGEVMAGLADAQSRADYANLLHGTPEDLLAEHSRRVWGPQQYMDIAHIGPGDTIINCGVDSGWELPLFISRMRGEGRIVNYDAQNVWREGVHGPFLSAFDSMMTDRRVLVGDAEGSVELARRPDGMLAPVSMAPDRPRERFDVVSLDSELRNGVFDRVDFLKMDVEGGEPAVLAGARSTIHACRPQLAVAIYHEPEHLWTLPLMLMRDLRDYAFHVRQHGYSRFESLLYAIPRERLNAGPAKQGFVRRGSDDAAGRGECLSSLWLADPPDRTRPYYARPVRTLTHWDGADWAGARLTPLGTFDADSIVAVQSADRGPARIAAILRGPDTCSIVTGHVDADGLQHWTAQRGIWPDATACALWSAEGGGVAVHSAAERALFVLDWAADGLADALLLNGIDQRPVAAMRIGGHVTLFGARAGDGVWRQTCPVGGGVGTLEDVTEAGRPAGLCAIRTPGAAPHEARPALAISHGDLTAIHALNGDASLSPVSALRIPLEGFDITGWSGSARITAR